MSFHAAIDPKRAAAGAYARTGDPASAHEQLVRDHMALVRRIAWHVHGSVSSSIEIEDLVQIGFVALVEAAGGFEDRGQVTFAQYLGTRLRGSMIDALRRQATITRGGMRRRREHAKAERDLGTELGRVPTEIEIAQRLGVEVCQLTAYRQAPVRFEPLDSAYDDENPWFVSDEPNAEDALADGELRGVLTAAIGELAEREQLVVQLYYVEELNLEEIGQVLGIGAARVCQIKKAAHDKLRAAVKARTE